MPSVIVLADADVGFDCVEWLIANYPADLAAIVSTGRNRIYDAACRNAIRTHVFENDEKFLEFTRDFPRLCDIGLTLWWPKIISNAVIASTTHGFINTHPSLLPHNRGRHYNFWVIVEQRPFGVSLHVIDDGIDSGPVVAQREISYTWEDTGESLFRKAVVEMKALFRDFYPTLRSLEFSARCQNLLQGTLHYSWELEPASQINLDEPMPPRHLLNLLRARTFTGYPACYFSDNGVEYEARIEIVRRSTR